MAGTTLGEEEVEARMRAGAFSQAGFLGPKERLRDVLSRDSRALKGLGLTYEKLAAKLDELIATAEVAKGHRARVGEIECEVEIYPGFQICPWAPDPHHSQCAAGGGVRHASVEWMIRNGRLGLEMRGPGLIVHLIRDHHFFEGLESPQRVEPLELAKLLGLG